MRGADIEFVCSRCGQNIAAEPQAAGVEVGCPACSHTLTVPSAERAGADLLPSSQDEEGIRSPRCTNRLNSRTQAPEPKDLELAQARAGHEAAAAELAAAAEWLERLQAGEAEREAALQEERRQRLSAEAKVRETSAALSEALEQLAMAGEQIGKLNAFQAAANGEMQRLRRLLREEVPEPERQTLHGQLAAAQAQCARFGDALRHVEEELEAERCAGGRMAAVVRELSRRLNEVSVFEPWRGDRELGRENEVLRGIAARLKGQIRLQHRELLRLRRARLGLRIVYGIFGLGLVGLGYVALQIFSGLEWSW